MKSCLMSAFLQNQIPVQCRVRNAEHPNFQLETFSILLACFNATWRREWFSLSKVGCVMLRYVIPLAILLVLIDKIAR